MSKNSLLIAALISAVLAAPAQAVSLGNSASLFGTQASSGYASRTIALGPETKSVTVASGESVTFRAGSQSASWTFLESIGAQAVNLSVLFPDLVGAKDVWVYIQPSEVFKAG